MILNLLLLYQLAVRKQTGPIVTPLCYVGPLLRQFDYDTNLLLYGLFLTT